MSFFSALLLTFRPKSYRDLYKQSGGKVFGYLCILSLLCSIMISAMTAMSFNRQLVIAKAWVGNEMLSFINDNLPEELQEIDEVARIVNGKLSSPLEQPFIYKKQESAFIIDTTGAISNLDDYKNGIFIGREKILLKTERSGGVGTRLEEYSLERVKDFALYKGNQLQGEILVVDLDGERLTLTIDLVQKFFAIFGSAMFPLMLGMFFVYYLITRPLLALIFSPISLILNAVSRGGLLYGELYKIGIYALTPPTVFAIMVDLFSLKVPTFVIVYCTTYVLFIMLAINSLNRAKPQLEIEEAL